jgi:AraC family transcriptional regulator
MDSASGLIRDSIGIIEGRLSEKISISELAGLAFFSKTHYQRLFHALVGEPVMEYIKKRRLRAACQELCETKESILDIALKYGYTSHEGFTRAFKAHFGVAPSKYRESNRAVFKKEDEIMKSKEMFSPEAFAALTEHVETVKKALSEFVTAARELCETSRRLAEADPNGAGVLVTAAELASLANRAEAVSGLDELLAKDMTLFERSERIFALIKNLDDIRFQMNLLALLNSVETARMGEHKAPYAAAEAEFHRLAAQLVPDKELGLVNDLAGVVAAEIYREAMAYMKVMDDALGECFAKGEGLINQMKKAAADAGKYGHGYLCVAEEINAKVSGLPGIRAQLAGYIKDAGADNSLNVFLANRQAICKLLEPIGDAAFMMNLAAFGAAVETARSGGRDGFRAGANETRRFAGHMQETWRSCAESFKEVVKLAELSVKDRGAASFSLIQKAVDDIRFMGGVLAFVLRLEAQRARKENFIKIGERATASLKLLATPGTEHELPACRQALERYWVEISEQAAKCRDEAAAVGEHGAAFAYIALEYERYLEIGRETAEVINSRG